MQGWRGLLTYVVRGELVLAHLHGDRRCERERGQQTRRRQQRRCLAPRHCCDSPRLSSTCRRCRLSLWRGAPKNGRAFPVRPALATLQTLIHGIPQVPPIDPVGRMVVSPHESAVTLGKYRVTALSKCAVITPGATQHPGRRYASASVGNVVWRRVSLSSARAHYAPD